MRRYTGALDGTEARNYELHFMHEQRKNSHEMFARTSRSLRGAAALALLAGLALAQDPLKDIKAKEPEKRLAAIVALESSGGDGAEKALVSALLDKDWEVVERAAVALGKVGSKAAVPQLVKTALDAPAMRLRRAAALSLLRIDAARATEDLAKQTAGKNALNAWSALAIVAAQGAGAESDGVAKNLKKSQKSKELDERLAAAGAIGAASLEDMAALLTGYLGGADAELACAALGAVAVRPDASFVPLLEAELSKEPLGDVVERRVVRGLAAIARVDAAAVVAALERLADGSPQSAARAMRLARALAAVADAKATAERVIERGLSHSDSDVRAAALHAGGGLKLEAVLKKARELAAKDGSTRVRLVALQELRDSVGDDAVLGVFTARLAGDADAEVREAAAAALGRSRSELAVKALVAALESGSIAGAALDVRMTEPPEADSLTLALRSMDNVILLPHIGAFTIEGQRRVVSSICRDVGAVLRGEPARHYANFPRPLKTGGRSE